MNLLVVITFLNMALLGFMSSMKGVSFPLIKNSFNVSYDNMGLLNALVYLAAVCACISAGVFMHRFGLKKAVSAAFFLVILGASSIYFASSFWMAVGFYLILQTGFSFFEISLNGVGIRVFIKKSALMMNLLHFFFGVGAIGGPRFMGFMVHQMGMNWQEVYPLALIAVFILLVVTLLIRFPGKAEPAGSYTGSSFWIALKDPKVWFFGCILGIACGLEGCNVVWSGLYLQDVYGLDPSTAGAVFISAFFLVYTLSRLLSGFIIEKAGYIRSIFVAGLATLIILTAGFILGKKGIYLLPAVGFFIAVMWPILMAISQGVFRERAQTAFSAIISITFTLNGLVQYSIGLYSRFLGPAWGYRSSVLYSAILVIMLLLLVRWNKLRGWMQS